MKCRKDVDVGEILYCTSCFEKLEEKYNSLKSDFDDLQASLETAEERITELEDEIGKAEKQSPISTKS